MLDLKNYSPPEGYCHCKEPIRYGCKYGFATGSYCRKCDKPISAFTEILVNRRRKCRSQKIV